METKTSIVDYLKSKEREEEKKKKSKTGWAKYWADVKAGKKKRVKPWSKKKAAIVQSEAPKEDIELDKKPFDKEGQEIKQELESKITDEKILEKKGLVTEPKEEKEEKEEGEEEKDKIKGSKGFGSNLTIKINPDWIVYGGIGIVILIILIKFLSKNPAPRNISSQPTPQPQYREFNIGTEDRPRIIKIPIQ